MVSLAIFHPHFSIRIFLSAIRHPPSAIRRHPVCTLQRPQPITWNSRNAPWIKNSKTWRFCFVYSDVLLKNSTRKKCVLNTECVKSGALEVDWFFVALSLEMKYFSRLVVVLSWRFELKVAGFHLSLVFTAFLSEVENDVKLFRICKTFWSIQTKLTKVFAGNWTLVLCERNQSLSRPVARDLLMMDLELRLPAWILYPE